MPDKTEGESCRVLEWSIDNFSCWNNEIHGNVIKSPESQTTPTFTVELYPRGLSGNDEHLVVHLTCSEYRYLRGNVSFIGSDGSVFCMQHVDSKEEKSALELPPGPKFEEVVTHIRQNVDLHGDLLILRYQILSQWDNIEHLQTTIEALDVSFKIYPEVFKIHSTGTEVIPLLQLPLHGTKMKPIRFLFSKKQIGHSKILLTLNPLDYEKKVSVFTRMSVLNNEDVLRTEEKEHLFRDDDSWAFCNSLTFVEVHKSGFSLILYFRMIPSSDYKHSFGLFQYHPFRMDIMSTHSIIRPLKTSISEKQVSNSLSNFNSHKPDSSVTVLTKELMCLYQDQDFSDFQLKCGDVSIPVHKAILSARSPVFKTMLTCDMKEAASGCMDITDLDPSTLCLFLTYLYTGGVEDLQGESALKLYYAADKYQVPSLKRECADFLSANLSISNMCDILSLANRHQDDQLIKVAKDFFLNNFNKVLASDEWKKFMKSEPLLAVETVTDFGEKKCVGKIDSA